MNVKPSIHDKTFNYDLGTVKMKLSDPTTIRPGFYSGRVNWNLSIVP